MHDFNYPLKTLVPELIKEFYVLYDEFVYEVGTAVEKELTRQLLPRSEDSEFWKALIEEKGKKRKKGETFAGNVCEIFKRELKFETNLNKFFQSQAEQSWKELVTKILGFFGQK